MLFLGKRELEKPKFSGTEGNLYLRNNQLYKYYLKPEDYDYGKILELKNRQREIKLTTLPLDGIFGVNKFVGVILKYFEHAQDLFYLLDIPIEYKIYFINQIEKRLKELTDNNIYHSDLHRCNILVPRNGIVELIDLDGLPTKLTDKPNHNLLQYVLKKYRSVLISYLYEEEFVEADTFGKDLVRRLNIREEFIQALFKNDLSYEVLKEFVDYTVKDKKYLKR